jgi:integrase
MTPKKKPQKKPLEIDIRHSRLRGGRLHISAGTSNQRTRERYVSDLKALIEDGRFDEIERLRAGEIGLGDIRAALRDGDMGRLRRVAEGALTLEAALERVMDVVDAAGVEGTAKEYRTVANLLRQHFGTAVELRDVTSDQARAFLQDEKQNGNRWSPGRQNVVRALVSRIWSDEIRREAEHARRLRASPRLVENPWKAVRLPRVRPTRFSFLQPAEWRAARDVTRGTPVCAFLALGCLAGLRQREAANLRPGQDVDLERRLLRVQPRQGEYPWRPKTERGERMVPMAVELATLLEEHATFAGSRYLIVLPGHDRPVSHATLQKWTREAFGAAGIRYGRSGDSLTYHSLRHTFATWLIQRDVNPMKVARLIGDTPEMVLRVYGHLMPEDLERAIQLVDQAAREGDGSE